MDHTTCEQCPPHDNGLYGKSWQMIPPAQNAMGCRQAIHGMLDIGGIDADGVQRQRYAGSSAKLACQQGDSAKDFQYSGYVNNGSGEWYPARGNQQQHVRSRDMQQPRKDIKACEGHTCHCSRRRCAGRLPAICHERSIIEPQFQGPSPLKRMWTSWSHTSGVRMDCDAFRMRSREPVWPSIRGARAVGSHRTDKKRTVSDDLLLLLIQ